MLLCYRLYRRAYHVNTPRCKKNSLHAFGYNSAESKPIWMKSGKMLAKQQLWLV